MKKLILLLPLFLLLQSCENDDDSDISKRTRYTIKYNCSGSDVRKAMFNNLPLDFSYNYYEVKIDIQEYDVNNNIIQVNTMETSAYYDEANNNQKVKAETSFHSLTNTTHLTIYIIYFFYNKYSESSKRLVGTATGYVGNVFYLYGVDDIIYINSYTPFSSRNPVSGHL